MVIQKPNFFLFTGGPGVGKTTLLGHLAALGERVVEETARAVIAEQIDSGGHITPWADPAGFATLCARRDIAIFDAMTGETDRVFFDRGIVDCYRANHVEPTVEIIEAIRTRRYNRQVFAFPPWREIYETDRERRQDWPTAEATFDHILRSLAELDYEAVVVPTGPVEERAAFVLSAT